MTEVLVAKPEGGATEWDVVPQVQVSLSKLQHVLLSVGVRVPLNERAGPQARVPHLRALGLVRRRPVPVLEMRSAVRPPALPGALVVTCAVWLVSMFLAAPSAREAAQPDRRERRAPPSHAAMALFAHSDDCVACHNGLTTPSGEDVSIGADLARRR